ncbi:hypothetical protein Acr_10g0009680 [Actinidia rufa]|uniref:CCHC-type domain-containing protein n=1 Tax=Actinidia rufa TaxID=165716 RepID=A0A7J0FAE5_9ERIC|nr:hypothetical protein Acr_10g0009680 [Actinidia rufa]
MALVVKKYQMFYKKQKPKTNVFENKKGNDENKFESKRSGEKKNGKNHVQGVQYYKCEGYGHIAQECPHKNNNKKKVFLVTTLDDVSQSDDSHAEEGESDGDKENFISFVATIHSHCSMSKYDSENSQKSSSFMDSGSEDSESGDEGAKYGSLKDAYDKLY